MKEKHFFLQQKESGPREAGDDHNYRNMPWIEVNNTFSWSGGAGISPGLGLQGFDQGWAFVQKTHIF